MLSFEERCRQKQEEEGAPGYPGLGKPLRHNQNNHNFYPLGAHGNCYGSETELISVRELAMIQIMEKLTDKENWSKKVFDDEIVAKWRKEALAIPDEHWWSAATAAKRQRFIDDGKVEFHDETWSWFTCGLKNIFNDTCFDVCIEELRSKAKYFERTGIIPTLDACASVAKSDTLVSAGLAGALRKAFDELKADQAASPDWHPNSYDMVQDLVHPSMYPLVYGRSRGFQEERVGVANAAQIWAGKGEVIPKDDWAPSERDRYRFGVGSGNVPPQYWSTTYQWLPSNVAFQKDGSVRFTSYINNLHPIKYANIYRTIEKFIETSLPMWDQCLATASMSEERHGAGRTKTRIPKPDDPDDENWNNWEPNDPNECANADVTEKQMEDEGWYHPEGASPDIEDDILHKWKVVRKPVIPEVSFKDVDYAPKEGKRLIDRFKKSGLQIIVKMASIELTPEKPNFPAGGWHVEGQMNEHICGTSLYYIDSENITNSNLSFRMQTSAYTNDDYDVGQDCFHWLEQIYGTTLSSGHSPCLQNYGSVETCEGRLLAFPNVFQHRVSPFELIDKTRPGHRRFMALWLVDPTKRIISTANIPPQQMSWYIESLLGSKPTARSDALSKLPPDLVTLLAEQGLNYIEAPKNAKLPAELMDMVRLIFQEDKLGMPMNVEEAKEHRAKLMEERKGFGKTAEAGWQEHTYSFFAVHLLLAAAANTLVNAFPQAIPAPILINRALPDPYPADLRVSSDYTRHPGHANVPSFRSFGLTNTVRRYTTTVVIVIGSTPTVIVASSLCPNAPDCHALLVGEPMVRRITGGVDKRTGFSPIDPVFLARESNTWELRLSARGR